MIIVNLYFNRENIRMVGEMNIQKLSKKLDNHIFLGRGYDYQAKNSF